MKKLYLNPNPNPNLKLNPKLKNPYPGPNHKMNQKANAVKLQLQNGVSGVSITAC